MNVLIIGAGDVGTNIINRLADSHDITVVDRDNARLDDISSTDTIHPVLGDGRSFETLQKAGIESADLLIASTDSDGANIMICGATKQLADVTTIARVKRIELYETWQEATDAFGIDQMLCVNLLAAQALVRTTMLPNALAVDTFVDEQVEMAEFAISTDSSIANQTVEEADRFAALTFSGILRDDDVIIPDGATTIEPGDRVVVIGSPSSVSRFARTLVGEASLDPDATIVVSGGGQVGVRTARLFEDRGFSTKVIERNPERGDEISSSLPGATILEGDATSAEFLRKRLNEVDIAISTLGDDETNYLASLLFSHFGIPNTITVVDAAEHVGLFEAAGIEVAARPREIAAGEIARQVHGRNAADVTLIENDDAEIIETRIDSDSALAGKSLRDIGNAFPSGFVIGAVVRGGTFTSPRGNTVIQTDDHVIAFLDSEIVDEIASKL